WGWPRCASAAGWAWPSPSSGSEPGRDDVERSAEVGGRGLVKRVDQAARDERQAEQEQQDVAAFRPARLHRVEAHRSALPRWLGLGEPVVLAELLGREPVQVLLYGRSERPRVRLGLRRPCEHDLAGGVLDANLPPLLGPHDVDDVVVQRTAPAFGEAWRSSCSSRGPSTDPRPTTY